MSPFVLALLLVAQDPAAAPDADPGDGPVATALPRKQTVAPLPIHGGPVSAPTDDYGYVGWCYGAVSGYVELYDRAMPDVIRIERAWPTPSTEDNIKVVYPGMKKEAQADLKVFARAIEAAEKASPTPIAKEGAAAIKKGRAVWTGATSVPTAQLAQFWMSWTPPAKCKETAKALEARSNLFGQALSANASEAPVVAAVSEDGADDDTKATDDDVTVAADEGAGADDGADLDEGLAVSEDPAGADDLVMTDETSGDEATTSDDVDGVSAIDGLLDSAKTDDAADEPAVDDEAEATATVESEDAVEADAPADKVAAPEPVAPAKPKRKPGLRETLTGLRGKQD